MQNITITGEKLTKLNELTDDIIKKENLASELLRTAQDRFNHVEEELERDGKKIKLTRNTLWQEVFYMGNACQAAEILKKYHQDVFDAYRAQEIAADELKKFCIVELGIDFTKMRIRDYMMLTQGMFEYLYAQKKIDERMTMQTEPKA